MKPKILYLVRHAKSSWDSDIATDHERTLNRRGLHDAPQMGKRLAQTGTLPEAIISSSAVRAQTTAKLIAKELAYNETDMEIMADLYGAGTNTLVEIINTLDPSLSQVMLVCHNPGITTLINWLSDAHIDDMPTCGIATLQISSDSWKDFTRAAAKLVRYDYPKKIQNS